MLRLMADLGVFGMRQNYAFLDLFLLQTKLVLSPALLLLPMFARTNENNKVGCFLSQGFPLTVCFASSLILLNPCTRISFEKFLPCVLRILTINGCLKLSFLFFKKPRLNKHLAQFKFLFNGGFGSF